MKHVGFQVRIKNHLFPPTVLVVLLWTGTRGSSVATKCYKQVLVGKHYFGLERTRREGQGARTKDRCKTGKWR